eukprot:CAMPEP_0174383882 /NCGR_PEP_ID=MMETSP0811_2-20130205/125547_1 /TAXON_ID=73025 ORGANISM="Eutreptiella gymnastica-like, Strain CCMP1594" /NCGR_SAMPLE_ID=MMETSP0811_2 /ASSEMBLY_ACC=CAM_ASM_000667 /LENGTH=51 /DNA_ID=CAMNT_0015537651 /DNA_START=261 /DNA_END=416 /DNA_ORIENTATION=-
MKPYASSGHDQSVVFPLKGSEMMSSLSNLAMAGDLRGRHHKNAHILFWAVI